MNAKLLTILKQSPYFTKHNLSLALRKEGKDLDYWIQKLLNEKLLLSLKKGFYVSSYYLDLIKQNPADYEPYLEYLANHLLVPSYVSLEYILAKHGFIPEAVFSVTSVSIKSSRTFISPLGGFIYRNLKQELFFGWERKKFADKEIRVAPLSKALIDFFYLKRIPKDVWLSYLLEEGRFNWDVLSDKNKSNFVQTINKLSINKLDKVVEILLANKIL